MLYRVTYNKEAKSFAVGGAQCTDAEAFEWVLRGIMHHEDDTNLETFKILGAIKRKALQSKK